MTGSSALASSSPSPSSGSDSHGPDPRGHGRTRRTRQAAATAVAAVLAAAGLGVAVAGPAAAEGSSTLTATCQSDGTYLVTFSHAVLTADSTVKNGSTAQMSNAYVGNIPISPSHVDNAGDVVSGSTSIPGTTAGLLQASIEIASPGGGAGGSASTTLAGDCVATPATPAADPVADPGAVVADVQVARPVVAVPRTAG
jgi:hypothetical protein